MPRRVARGGLVLHDRIELSTSPLPRECSTTELVQRRLATPRTRRVERVISRLIRRVQPPGMMGRYDGQGTEQPAPA